MKRPCTAAVIAAVLAIGTSVSAQWPQFDTPGIPRAADGTPDLTGPAPRTPDGKPDLSGLWENFRSRDQAVESVNAPFGSEIRQSLIDEFRDIGTGVEGGLPFQPWAAQLKKQRMADNSKDNPDAHCLPMGIVQFHTHVEPRKIAQTPSLLVIMYEGNYGLRQIHLDGRPLPPQGEPQPWWYGYSTGRWDGDTLVVETNNFRDEGWLDIYGSPLTDAATITERFRRPNLGRLEIEITVDDPKAYTRPWTVTLTQRLMVDDEMIEFICNENERSSQHYVG